MKSLHFVCILSLAALFFEGCGKPAPEESFEEAVRLMQQQNFVSARHRFEEIAKDNPDFEYIAEKNPKTLYSWKARIRLGEMARIDKRYDESETYYRAAIDDVTEEGPKLTAMNSLVRTFQEAGKIDASVETLGQMLAIAKNAEFKMRIGIQLVNVLISQNKKDEAWKVLTSLYNPKDPEDAK
ncbi:MAG: tetratricopeptide repeat protein, partial [Candidatus Omnitrophica bacterium]|nr:tetratricopeptide repeat protein [Candidatus Omnitrophota bacterium]